MEFRKTAAIGTNSAFIMAGGDRCSLARGDY